jgi:hypothetical protein
MRKSGVASRGNEMMATEKRVSNICQEEPCESCDS